MIAHVFATKQKMTQAWTLSGKRVAVTCLSVKNNAIISEQKSTDPTKRVFEVGYGLRKLKNTPKPLRSKLEKSGFSFGVAKTRSVKVSADETATPGQQIKVEQVLQVGDVVKVQGVTKGRGFAGAMKRHNFQGGPKTHGQSDRWRAVGAIGQRTTPGRVFVGKKMPGHYGVDTQSVLGLVVLYVNPSTQEFWLSGPIPGHFNSLVTITKTGETKNMELDKKASGIPEQAPAVEEAPAPTVDSATQEAK